MKKLIPIAVVILVVAAIAAPPLIGGVMESTVRTRIERMDDNPMFAMRIVEYDRSWFSSQAEIEMALDERYFDLLAATGDINDAQMTAMMNEQSIHIPVSLTHGPVIVSDGLYFGLARLYAVLDNRDQLAAMAMQELGLDYLAELRGQVSYLGRFSFLGNVPPIDYYDESGQLQFSGLNIEGSAHRGNLQLDGGFNSLAMDADGTAATIENLFLTSDSDQINQALWIGEFDSGIESLVIVDTYGGAGDALRFSGLRANGSTDLDATGELLEATATYIAETVHIPELDMELTDTEVTVSIENISAQAMTDYYENMFNIDPQNPDAAIVAMQDLSGRILENNPGISVDPIRFTLDGESLTAAISARIVNADQGNADFTNPFALLSMLEASADLSASKPLFLRLASLGAAGQMGSIRPGDLPPGETVESMAEAQAQLMIANFLAPGYLVDDGENYTTDIDYANGEVRINGNPLPLGAMLQ